MRVLHLPNNISSQISVSVRGLRALGVEARGLARQFTAIQNHEGIEVVEWTGRPGPLARLRRSLSWRLKLIRAMQWADVVHWHWGDTTCKGLDLKVAAWLNRPRVVEYWGDDIRLSTTASRDNPYLKRMYAAHPELALDQSLRSQALFRRYGFECMVPGRELSDYIDPGIFPTYHLSKVRVATEDYTPQPPALERKRPLVVHAPSDKQRKGTEAVLQHVERLAHTHSFDFKLIHQMPRSEAMKIVADCDVFLDQFTIGAEGLAAYEAMAWAKPVLCFLKPAWQARYPTNFPIVSADQENLSDVLGPLLQDGARRRDLGLRGRRFVEDHHDARKVAQELLNIYQDLRRRHAGSPRGKPITQS